MDITSEVKLLPKFNYFLLVYFDPVNSFVLIMEIINSQGDLTNVWPIKALLDLADV